MRVTVEPRRLGPVELAARRVRQPPKGGNADAWIQHDLVLRNVGERSLTLGDTRTSALLGPPDNPVVLAADKGCGYALEGKRVTPGACLLYEAVVTLDPGESTRRRITLFRGLRGMAPLTAGTYVFHEPVAFKAGTNAPAVVSARPTAVRVVYRLRPAQLTTGR